MMLILLKIINILIITQNKQLLNHFFNYLFFKMHEIQDYNNNFNKYEILSAKYNSLFNNYIMVNIIF
jgi:hypothetical protein